MVGRKPQPVLPTPLFTSAEQRQHAGGVPPLYVSLAKAFFIVVAALLVLAAAGGAPLAGLLIPGAFILNTAPKPLRVVIVCRVSTKRQADDDKVSLDEQEGHQLSWATELGWVVVEVIKIGHTGSKEDAPHFNRVQELFDSGQADAVSFYSVDRFARRALVGLNMMQRWAEAGKSVFIGKREMGVDDPTEEFTFLILLACAQLKWAQNRKAARAKATYVAKGKWTGPAPFGYDVVEDVLVPNQHAGLVKTFLESAYAVGYAVAILGPEASALLQAAGKIGKRIDVQRRFLRAVVFERAYMGVTHWGEAVGKHDAALVTEDLLIDAQASVPIRANRANVGKQALGNASAKVDLNIFLERLLGQSGVVCTECWNPLFLSGAESTAHGDSPILECRNKHGFTLLKDVDWVRTAPFQCADCRTRDVNVLHVAKTGEGWLVTCRRCPTFSMQSARFPFATHLEASYAPEPAMVPAVGQGRLTDFFGEGIFVED